MRKLVIGTGLGLAAAAAAPGLAAVGVVGEPAGVSAAGKLGLAAAPQGDQGVLIGLNKAGDNQQKVKIDSQHKVDNQVKLNTQDKWTPGDGSVYKGQVQQKGQPAGNPYVKF
jgi:hypothetical protein